MRRMRLLWFSDVPTLQSLAQPTTKIKMRYKYIKWSSLGYLGVTKDHSK